jgi:hypothetical protein
VSRWALGSPVVQGDHHSRATMMAIRDIDPVIYWYTIIPGTIYGIQRLLQVHLNTRYIQYHDTILYTIPYTMIPLNRHTAHRVRHPIHTYNYSTSSKDSLHVWVHTYIYRGMHSSLNTDSTFCTTVHFALLVLLSLTGSPDLPPWTRA